MRMTTFGRVEHLVVLSLAINIIIVVEKGPEGLIETKASESFHEITLVRGRGCGQKYEKAGPSLLSVIFGTFLAISHTNRRNTNNKKKGSTRDSDDNLSLWPRILRRGWVRHHDEPQLPQTLAEGVLSGLSCQWAIRSRNLGRRNSDISHDGNIVQYIYRNCADRVSRVVTDFSYQLPVRE